MTVHVTRLPIRLAPDPTRVITRLFMPGEANRIQDIVARLCSMSRDETEMIVANLERTFERIHPDIDEVFLKHFENVEPYIPNELPVSDSLRRLIGACFTMEYSVESAAL